MTNYSGRIGMDYEKCETAAKLLSNAADSPLQFAKATMGYADSAVSAARLVSCSVSSQETGLGKSQKALAQLEESIQSLKAHFQQ